MKQKIITLLILFASNFLFSQLKTSKLFSNHAVLQQNQPIKIWGTHSKGKKLK